MRRKQQLEKLGELFPIIAGVCNLFLIAVCNCMSRGIELTAIHGLDCSEIHSLDRRYVLCKSATLTSTPKRGRTPTAASGPRRDGISMLGSPIELTRQDYLPRSGY